MLDKSHILADCEDCVLYKMLYPENTLTQDMKNTVDEWVAKYILEPV